jgi:hypothetical protein
MAARRGDAEVRPTPEFAMSRALTVLRLPIAVSFATALLCACPSQELAPLIPCTIAGSFTDVQQSGVDKVDLLFVVDNSGSMADEQVKLNQQLQRLVTVLATGDLDGIPNANGRPDFTPVSSLHLGVVSTDLGVNGQTGIVSCGDASYKATELNTATTRERLIKPHGDDGKLLSSPDVAVVGVNVRVPGSDMPMQSIAPRPECAGVNVNRFLTFDSMTSNAADIARQFSCIAELGVNGCGYEQQLESMWRALAPSTDNSFSGKTSGQGAPSGLNAGFLRNDAILVVIVVSDEEDCSSPDASGATLYQAPTAANNANLLCTRHPEALHPVSRYVQGLLSLKPAYKDRIIFAGIVGVPLAANRGERTPDQILSMPEMAYVEEGSPQLALRPACVAGNKAGKADPAQRMVKVAKEFGENGVITSICEDDYGPALTTVIQRIAKQLTGACLPRQLKVNAQGMVDCKVVEIKGPDDKTPCLATKGRKAQLQPRIVQDTERIVCEMTQLPVLDRKTPSGDGWYYDTFSDALNKSCSVNKQRIAFSEGAPLSPEASARVECQQTVLNGDKMPLGQEAINVPCADDGSGNPSGDDKCKAFNQPELGALLLCVQGTCQLSCARDIDCPTGFVCSPAELAPRYCVNPTCPIAE